MAGLPRARLPHRHGRAFWAHCWRSNALSGWHGLAFHPWAGSSPLYSSPLRSFLGVPILSPAWVYGWLCLCNKSGAEQFSEEDERLAEALAAQAAVAYENGRRYEEIQRQAAELRREMAELHRARDVLGRQHRLIDAIFDNILAHVCYLDRDFCFMRVNATYAQSRGYTPEELVGRNYFELFPDPELRAIFERVRDTGELYVSRSHPMVRADRPNGDVTYWDWWLRPICSPEGDTEGLVLSLVDVTLIESSRRDVEYLNADLREANSAKDQFLAEVSHELRNPLAPILAGLEILRRTISPEELPQRALEVIERNAKLQARLVNDLLDLSRITSGKLQLQRAPVALNAVVESALQALQGEAEKAEVSLRTDAQAGLWVYGDLDRLQQLVMNLLGNAIKFTGASGAVRVKTEEADGKGRIVVDDTGIGIANDLLPHLFERFRQGDVAGQRKPGLGIGLALVKSIAERHGGRVWAESPGPGKGSQFFVELPLIPAPDRPSPAVPSGGKLGPIRLLLVEDNPDTRALVASGLEMRDYRVLATDSAEDALEMLKQARPDVILSDIVLPGINGYEFLRRARQMPGLTDIAAFAITGFGQEEDVRQAREVGYLGHFVKPVEIEALDRHIRRWLEASPES